MSQLHLSLLGSPEIRHQEQIVKFRTRKALALLIYLAVEGGMHSREKLIALFWPDLDEVRGRVILRRTLALLREALEEAAVMPHETHLIVERNALGIRCISSTISDFCLLNTTFNRVRPQFPLGGTQNEDRRLLIRQLLEGLQLVRGGFLGDFSLPNAPAFDAWMSTQHEAIRRRVSVLFDFLSSLQLEKGELSDALVTATRWVAFDPGDEVATRRLMQAYFTMGRREEALRAYEAARGWLLHELDVEPAPETMALAERFRREEPVRIVTGRAAADTSIHLDGPLVGRAEEYASLIERYHHVQRRESHVILIEGEAGIGKTRLVTDFLGWAAMQGADVVHGRAFANGNRLTYQLAVDTLRQRVEQENAPDDILSDTWLSELSRILPELRDRYPDLPLPIADESTGQTRLFEAVARLGQVWASRRPLVLFIDDLQWADNASRDLFAYIIQQWWKSQLPVLFVASVRTEELFMMPDLQEWFFNLKQVVPTLSLTLEALCYDDFKQWVQYLDEYVLQPEGENMTAGKETPPASDAPFVRWLFDKTQGHPLYIEELLRTLLERQMLNAVVRPDGTWGIDASVTASEVARWQHILPSRIHDTIRMRLTHLSPIARSLLSAGSVLCHDFTLEQLCQVVDLQDNDVLAGLDELVGRHLLVEQVNRVVTYAFSHDTLREVVYREIGESRRRIYHRRVLQRLRITDAPAELIAHYEQGAGNLEPSKSSVRSW
jgi:DNA-binding SARP family transcriptional activator